MGVLLQLRDRVNPKPGSACCAEAAAGCSVHAGGDGLVPAARGPGSNALLPTLVVLAAQRRQQGAAFTPEAMDSYLPRVEATCRQYLDRWAGQDCIDVQEEVRQFSMAFWVQGVEGLAALAYAGRGCINVQEEVHHPPLSLLSCRRPTLINLRKPSAMCAAPAGGQAGV